MRQKTKPRIFVDSNVIFSGLYSGAGPPADILERAAEGRFTMVISRQVLDEVVRTLAVKLPAALPALQELLSSMPLEICADPSPSDMRVWAKVVGENDAPIAAAAWAAEVDSLVSGDGHFLKVAAVAGRKGLRVVSPAELVGRLREEAPGED